MKWTYRFGAAWVAGALAVGGATGTAAAQQAVEAGAAGGEVEQLIEQLAAEDPKEREDAAAKLRAKGGAVRDALTAAAESVDPAIAQQARALLRELPWYDAKDRHGVRTLLNNYQATQPQDRAQALVGMARQATGDAGVALVRIAQQEPSDVLRWQAAQMLRNRGRDDDRQVLRTIPHETPNTPLLSAIAWAWERVDAAKSTDLYRQVLRAERERATRSVPPQEVRQQLSARRQPQVVIGPNGRPQLLEVDDDVVSMARLEKLPMGAVVTRLQQIALETDDLALLGEAWRTLIGHLSDEPEWRTQAVRHLLSMHAMFGPLPGFEGDLQTYADELREPVDLHLIAESARRRGRDLVAEELTRTALAVNAGRAQERVETAARLLALHWCAPAERELTAMLAEPFAAEVHPAQRQFLTVAAHLTLAHIVGVAGDEPAAAAHVQVALDKAGGMDEDNVQPLANATYRGHDGAREQLHWWRMLAARKTGNDADVQKELDALVALSPRNPDVLFDVTTELRARGRRDDAKRLFDDAVRDSRRRDIEEVPVASMTAVQLNDRAWLFARGGDRLEEAQSMAKRAVEKEPDNAAYLDTLAEVEFRLGNVEEAVRLETLALQLAPGMPFMKQQLERYKRGKPEPR